jgi:hypothetical protein
LSKTVHHTKSEVILKSEERDQIEFVNFIHRKYPEQFECLHHSPNGGKRDARTAGKMKLMGTKKGFPDLVLFQGRGGCSGLVIEAKRQKGGKVSKEQESWLDHFETQGYFVALCRGQDEMLQAFSEYMTLKKNEPCVARGWRVAYD